jgi:hypothetical protein
MTQSSAFYTFDYWWTNLIENPTTAVWTFNAWQCFKTIWGYFTMTIMTSVYHGVPPF